MKPQVSNIHEELIARCKGGDREAHFQLYKLYARAMYNVSYRITGRAEDAEDALQEAFISAFRNLNSYRGDAAFGAWLKRIVVNKAINLVKKHRLERIPDDETWEVPETEPSSEYREGLTVERVQKAMEALPDGYRTVLSLYLIEGYDHEEIGQILNISESTSKSQLNRAKSKLRDILSKQI